MRISRNFCPLYSQHKQIFKIAHQGTFSHVLTQWSGEINFSTCRKTHIRYFFCKKFYCIIAFIAYCNSFLRGQLLHIAIFNSFFSHYCYCYCNSSDGYCQCLGHDIAHLLLALPQSLLSALLQLYASKYILQYCNFIQYMCL